MAVLRCGEYEVVELQVAVDDTLAVHVLDATQDLHHVTDCARLGDGTLAHHQVEQLAPLARSRLRLRLRLRARLRGRSSVRRRVMAEQLAPIG